MKPLDHMGVLGLCLAGITTAMSAATPLPRAARTLVVTAYEYSFQAPDSVAAGVVTVRLVNRGKRGHQVEIARLDDTSSLERVMRTLVENRKRTTGIRWAGGVENAIPGHASETMLVLRPGKYVVVCSYDDDNGHAHASSGMLRALTVTAGPATADTMLPNTPVTAHLADYSITFSGPLHSGTQLVRVQNDGPHRHHLNVQRIVGNATLSEIDKWDGKTEPAPITDAGGGVAVLEPGGASVMTLTLRPGRYVFACVMSDSSGKPPHYMLGMEKEVAIR